MNILFCLGSMDKGGSQRVIANLSNYLVNNNEVSIVTTTSRESQYHLDDKIKRFCLDENEKKLNNISRIYKLKKVIKKVEPDVIVTFQPEPSFRILLLKIINNIPIILSVRNDPNVEYKSFKRKILMKMLFPLADGFVFQTRDAASYFSKKIQEKSTIIPNPINEKFIVDTPYLEEREKTIVTVGRLEKQKNQKLLIDAFKNVEKKHKDYKLLIYGEGSLKKELEEYVSLINLTNKIIFKGQVDNIKEEIFKAGVFVLSSDYEGMPNALMEAMSLGLPCISTDCPCGGPKTLIKNKKNGILVEVNNIKQIQDAINKIIEEREFAQLLGRKACEISKDLEPRKINNMWIEYINRHKSCEDKR